MIYRVPIFYRILRWFCPSGLNYRALTIDPDGLRLDCGRSTLWYPFEELDPVGIESRKLWDSLTLAPAPAQTKQPGHLSFITQAKSRGLYELANQLWAEHFLQKRLSLISAAFTDLRGLCDTERYVANGQVRDFLAAHLPLSFLAKDLPPAAQKVFQASEHSKPLELLAAVFREPAGFFEARNRLWVPAEMKRWKEFFDTIEKTPLTERQREAIVIDEDNNLIVAGAGSGKTSVIAGKVRYLLEKGLAKPEEILLLAYARDARDEMAARVGGDAANAPTVHTFHSLGLAIQAKALGKKQSVDPRVANRDDMAQLIEEFIEKLLKDDEEFGRNFVECYGELPRDRSMFEFDRQESLEHYLRTYEIKPIKGEKMRSAEEVKVANFLTMHGVRYQYEKRYEIDTATEAHPQYKPDFYLFDHKIYLEHFAISRDGKTPPFIPQEKYLAGIKWKRALHQKHGTKLIETYSWESSEGVLADNLKAKLEAAGVPCRLLSPEKFLELVKGGARSAMLMTRLMGTFLDHFKCGGGTMEELRARAESRREKLFVELFAKVYELYTAYLAANGSIDFHDMILEGTRHINSGVFQSPYRYILCDEYQDISRARAELVKSLLAQRNGARLMAVGDDWQSIYKFSGSDLSVLTDFKKMYGATRRVDLDQTFRFNDYLARAATLFITKNPAQLKKKIRSGRDDWDISVSIRYAQTESILYGQQDDSPRDQLKEEALGGVLAEIGRIVKPKESVLLLGRYRHNEPRELPRLRREHKLPSLKYKTVHGSKGLGAEYVVVLDVKGGPSGFPSLREDDPLVNLVMTKGEEFELAEERRLFYVAITRAKKKVYLLAPAGNPSPFLSELTEIMHQMRSSPSCS